MDHWSRPHARRSASATPDAEGQRFQAIQVELWMIYLQLMAVIGHPSDTDPRPASAVDWAKVRALEARRDALERERDAMQRPR